MTSGRLHPLIASASEVAGRIYDLVVIGGGITGAGIAWRAAQKGRSVLLVEANDFGAGTSSRSTKLIHGGLRYLAQGEFALVRDGVRDRHQIHAIAPHLTEPRWMLIPARSHLELLKYLAAIRLYERLGRVPRADRRRPLHGSGLKGFEPLMRTDVTPYGCAYREFLTDDARLVIAVLRGAVGFGAQVLSYTPVKAIDRRGPALEVLLAIADEGAIVRARQVVNATGPWVEGLAATHSGRLALSKGVHISVPHRLLPARHLLMLVAGDGRPVFIVPRGEISYIGTTDSLSGAGPELWPSIEMRDVTYLLETVRTHCDSRISGPEDLVGSWAGLRPLVRQSGRSTRKMSRRDEIWVDHRGVFTIAGGKLTGFRGMADRALRTLGISPSRTIPLLPGGDFEDRNALVRDLASSTLNSRAAERLVTNYGSEAATVLSLGDEPVGGSEAILSGEVKWGVIAEGARTLEDLVYRRNRLAIFSPQTLRELLPAVAQHMRRYRSWTDTETRVQISTVADRLRRDLEFH